MDTELSQATIAVAGKIIRVAELVGRLRAENAALRARLIVEEAERQRLQAQSQAACERLQALLERIPEDAA